MYFGKGEDVPKLPEAARRTAREARAEANRKRTCCACELVTVSPKEQPSTAIRSA